MSYVNKILLPNEKIIYQANRNLLSILILLLPIGYVIPLFFTFIIVIAEKSIDYKFFIIVIVMFILFSAISFFISKIIVTKTELTITNKRIISKTGIIRVDTIEMYLNKIESISIEQSILGRFLGYGSIIIHGYGGSEALIMDISNPLNFKRELELLYDQIRVNKDLES